MAESYFLNFLLLDVASVSWDISSDFLNRASHILQIQSSSLNEYAFLTKDFDSYGNVSFNPCEYTLHTAANAENNDCSKKLVCFLQHMNMCEKMVTIRHQLMLTYSSCA
jgi:hypothetical protein